MQLNTAGYQKKAYAHQSWPSIVNYIITIKPHHAIRKSNVQKNNTGYTKTTLDTQK